MWYFSKFEWKLFPVGPDMSATTVIGVFSGVTIVPFQYLREESLALDVMEVYHLS